jgi:uncharacterized protein (TIGR03437 family)
MGLLLATLPGIAWSQAPPPRLFFSDIVSGPNTGGQDNNGAFVALYGNYFGSNPTVTVGGGQALIALAPAPYLWYQKMTIQLGPLAQSGNIVVSNSSGTSNGLPFTVRSGKIYFVATNGKDSNSGSYTRPWRTLVQAVQNTGAGSIIYAMDGVSQTTDDGQGWHAAILLRNDWCQGTAANPKALIAYPGAAVTVGNPTGSSPSFGIRAADSSSSGGACSGNWVFAGLNLRGPQPIQTAGPSTNWRIVGNDISNPQAGGGGGGGSALGLMQSTYAKILGNNGHDLNLASTDRLQQGFYPSTDSNHIEMAWNMIANAKGRAGIQIHSSPVSSGNGYSMYDISIHDNVVHDIAEEGILIDTVDPSKGPVTVYNNVVYNVGLDGRSDGAIYRADSSDYDTSQGVGSGYVDIYNNTIFAYKAGPGFGNSFEVHQGQALVDRLRNNLILSPGGPYFDVTQSRTNSACSTGDSALACPNFVGSNNLLYGAGAPTFTNLVTGSINLDPKLVGATYDGRLQSGSPAIGAGVAIPGLETDIDGNARPQGAAPDIGAYEHQTGTQAAAPVVAAVVNAASYFLGGISPGELLACFGSNLGPSAPSIAADGQIEPTLLGGTQVLFDGVAAQLWYVQANQINVLVPPAVSGQSSVSVVVDANGVVSEAVPVVVHPALPGVFTLDMSGQGQAIVLNQDGTLNLPANPAPRNSTIQVYATGLGETNADLAGSVNTAGAPLAAVAVTIGGVASQVLQAMGLGGVFEIDALVPAAAPAGPSVPLILTAAGAASQAAATVAIQ